MKRILAVLTTLFAISVLATHSSALLAAPTKQCVDEIMIGKKINWGGGTEWARPNAERLCEGARSRAPIECFEGQIKAGQQWPAAIDECTQARLDGRHRQGPCVTEIQSGTVNWGGGSVWNPNNIFNLCGTNESDKNVEPARCFSAGIAQKLDWPQAISICSRPAMDAKQHCVQKVVGTVAGIDGRGKTFKPSDREDIYTWQLAFYKCGLGGEPQGLAQKALSETRCGKEVKDLLGTTHMMALCGNSLDNEVPLSALCFKASRKVLTNDRYNQLMPPQILKWKTDKSKKKDYVTAINELAIDLCRNAENNRTVQRFRKNVPLNEDCLVAGLEHGIPAKRVIDQFCRNDENKGEPVNRCILNGDGKGGKPSSDYHGPIFNNVGEYRNTFKDGFKNCV